MRFPEFEGEWKWHKLGNVANISKGFGISKDQISEKGQSCILYGELYTKYKSEVIQTVLSRTDINFPNLVKSKANDVIIPSSGETAIDIATARCVPFSDVLLGGDLNIIRLKNDNGSFLSYQLNSVRKQDIAKVAQGISVIHLYGDSLKKMKVSICSYEEQQKIANFLSLIDERIATQIKIIEDLKLLKSTISNRLQQSDLLDINIRLSEIGQLKNGYAFRSNTYEEDGKFRILTIANVKGERYVDSDSCCFISELPQDIQAHQVLKPNDILISLTGNVGRVSLCKDGAYLLNQRVGLFDLKQTIAQEYVYQVLSSKRFEQAMTFCGQGAAQMNIGKSDVENYSIPYSYSPEVLENIANTLKAFDDKIDLESRLLQQLNSQKKYFLLKIFI